MSVDVEVLDSKTRNKLKIGREGEITVTQHTHPPHDEKVLSYPWGQWFTDDGTPSGGEDMTVDGSSTPVRYFIKAQEDRDIYIKSISVLISQQNARLNLFGAQPALTNGVSFEYKNNDIGDVVLQDEIKTNLDFIRLGIDTQGLGSGSTAYRADISGSSADSYLPVLDLQRTYGMPWGLRLRKGSEDFLAFFVRDDLSALTTFNIRAGGSQLI